LDDFVAVLLHAGYELELGGAKRYGVQPSRSEAYAKRPKVTIAAASSNGF
jgi:hypothetical protein